MKYTLEHSGCKCGNGTGTTTTSHPGQTTSSTTNSGFTKSTTAKTPTSSGKRNFILGVLVSQQYTRNVAID